MVKRLILMMLALMVLSVSVFAGSAPEKVLIRTSKPYDKVVAAIESAGGTVTYQYKYANGIAAQIPPEAMQKIRALVGPTAMTKDELVQVPGSMPTRATKAVPGYTMGDGVAQYDDAQPITPEMLKQNPTTYLFNNATTRVSELFSSGLTGNGVKVAVIDTGIRPGFPHIAGTVIGGEDFVGDGLGFSNTANNPHGTFVSGMIAAHVGFLFQNTSAFAQAVHAYAPDSVSAYAPGVSLISMVGSAPAASVYMLRVFAPTGGAPTSTIMAAMDRVLELRDLYEKGQGGQNLKVCNMSIGGATVFAGNTIYEELVTTMLNKDIVMTISASNAGPSSLTVGAPGSSFGAITVGATTDARNMRIYYDLVYGPGIGGLVRPSSAMQTAYFSSRGPDANGNRDPDVAASGMLNFGQGYGNTNQLSFGSGTSFSSPTVAGVAAVLRQAFPSATARQIRNAIIATANPSLMGDGSTYVDVGKGFVDAKAAADLLATGTVPDTLSPGPNPKPDVKVNVEQNTFLTTYTDSILLNTGSLLPGQRNDILYRVLPNSKQVIITLTGITPELPPAQQNAVFGDDLLFTVHSAKTSAIGEGDYYVFDFFNSNKTFVINNPETGIMRITPVGDYTNAGRVSATVGVTSLVDPIPQLTLQGKIDQGKQAAFQYVIPAGVKEADFRMIFRQDWSSYPTSDIDMYVIDPDGNWNTDGATLNDPEHAVVANPKAGVWTVFIDGFAIYTAFDKLELRVALDGNVIH